MSPSPGRRIVGTQKNPLEGLSCNALTIPQAPARRRRIAHPRNEPPSPTHHEPTVGAAFELETCDSAFPRSLASSPVQLLIQLGEREQTSALSRR